MRQMEDKTKEELQKAQQANSSSVPKVILAVRSAHNLIFNLSKIRIYDGSLSKKKTKTNGRYF